MDFLEVCGLRRSIRIFDKRKPVAAEQVQRILEVVRVATSCPGNLQPWRAIVIEQEKLPAADRKTLLAADNYQAAHAQAPVWIYWCADTEAARPEQFRARVHELIDLGALPTFYGWTHGTVDGSILRGEVAPEGMANIEQIIHGMPREVSAMIARQETVGACAIAVLAAVNEGLGTCLHSCAGADKVGDVRRVLKLPESWDAIWVQLVGHPLEDREAGGQRPRLPYEQLFFEQEYGRPLARDPRVVQTLEREGLLRAPMPKPGRFEELKRLARDLGYPI
ncbi:MAG: nitroreductase family protein [Candidatus Binatia bacterium]